MVDISNSSESDYTIWENMVFYFACGMFIFWGLVGFRAFTLPEVLSVFVKTATEVPILPV